VLDELSERDRTILRMRYGLGGESFHSQYDIASRLGLKQPLVSSVVRRVTARLLGWQVVDPDRRHQVRCAVCGAITQVQRVKPGREQTCGRECTNELLRRKIRADRQTRRMAELMPVRERLSRLPAETFLVFGDRDRAIVRRYYGLDQDGTFHTQDELGQAFGIHQTTIGAIVRAAVARLFPQTCAADDAAARTRAQDDGRIRIRILDRTR
jgi:hypothetical protein